MGVFIYQFSVKYYVVLFRDIGVQVPVSNWSLKTTDAGNTVNVPGLRE